MNAGMDGRIGRQWGDCDIAGLGYREEEAGDTRNQ